MKDFQRDLDRDHVPRDSNREPRAHVSDAIQIAMRFKSRDPCPCERRDSNRQARACASDVWADW